MKLHAVKPIENVSDNDLKNALMVQLRGTAVSFGMYTGDVRKQVS